MTGFVVGLMIGTLGAVLLTERRVKKNENKGDEV